MHPLIDICPLRTPGALVLGLGKVAYLGRQDFNDVGVVEREGLVAEHDAAKGFGGVRGIRTGTIEFHPKPFVTAEHGRRQDLGLGREVVINAGSGDADGGADVVHADPGEALLGEQRGGL